MEGMFSEHIPTKVALRGDLDNQETARVSLKDAHKIALMVSVANVAEDMVFTLRQHDAESGGNSKDLVISNPLYFKDDAAAQGVKIDAPDTAQATISELNGVAGYVTVEVLAEELDVDGDFSYVSLQIADLAAARVGVVHAQSIMPRHKPAYKVEL